MSIVRRFASLLLAAVLALALAIPAAAETTLLPGLVQVEDGVCTVSCRGETLAEFPVEDPVYAALTTTSKGTPAVVVTWGDFTQDEKRTVLLPAGLELLRLEGSFSLVTLAGTLPDSLAVEIPAAFSSGGLEIGCPGPVAVDGEVSTIYLTSPHSQVTLSDSLDALVYNYHNIAVQGGEGCETLSSHDITRRQQESWKKDAPAAIAPAQPENPFANLSGSVQSAVSLPSSSAEASLTFTVENGVVIWPAIVYDIPRHSDVSFSHAFAMERPVDPKGYAVFDGSGDFSHGVELSDGIRLFPGPAQLRIAFTDAQSGIAEYTVQYKLNDQSSETLTATYTWNFTLEPET